MTGQTTRLHGYAIILHVLSWEGIPGPLAGNLLAKLLNVFLLVVRKGFFKGWRKRFLLIKTHIYEGASNGSVKV